MPGVSGHQLAKILGISEPGVRKAKAGRLKAALLADGTFDVEIAKRLYAANTDPSKKRDRPAPAGATPPSSALAANAAPADEAPASLPAPAGPDVNKARAFKILEEAKITQIKRKKLEQTAIDRAATVTLVQTLARSFRDGLLGFTDKHYAQIAMELGADPHLTSQVLDKYLLRYLEKAVHGIQVEGVL
ncbi:MULTISPECIES: hypothetical protein [Methylobacterium]|uniref:hypothetical protein n=1 Tax=Methylobacterium TaxID=407 RepID=UPI00272EB9F6|nr:hypothetical protein [Methylobacterium sp.]